MLFGGLLFIGAGEHFPQVREGKGFAANRGLIHHRRALKKAFESILTRSGTFASVQSPCFVTTPLLATFASSGKIGARSFLTVVLGGAP